MSIFRRIGDFFTRAKTYTAPGSDILPYIGEHSAGAMAHSPQSVADALAACGIPCFPAGHAAGPSTVQYHFNLANLKDHGKLARASAALGARLRANAILARSESADFAVTVPRMERATVAFRDVIETMAYHKVRGATGAVLGMSASNMPIAIDIADMPHLLIAGATGSGKTVAMHTIITSLLMGGNPGKLKFVMIDPKRIELSMYEGIPHLMRPIVTEVGEAVSALDYVCRLMDQRYRDIRNGRTGHPRIVVVIDELADLMLTSKKRVEASVVRIAQMGRAAGIHLLIATQQPRASVLTGLVRANIPARLALTMASYRDSGIMEVKGADKLSGRGDALLQLPNHTIPPIRLQCAYTSPQDIQAVVNWWKSRDSRRAAR